MPQLEVLPEKQGSCWCGAGPAALGLSTARGGEGGHKGSGEILFSQLPMVDDKKMEHSSGETKKPTYFIYKGNNLSTGAGYTVFHQNNQQMLE